MSASIIRRSTKNLLTISFDGRNLQWRLSNVGSFIAARCENQSVTVREAAACLETIQSEIIEVETAAKWAGRCPNFGWCDGGIVANWSFN